MKFKLRQSGADRSDCTAPYDVIILENGTVKDFIDEVLENRQGEWGTIAIFSKESPFGSPRMEYRHGKPISRESLTEYEDKQVISIKANGGWSNMDYVIKTQ